MKTLLAAVLVLLVACPLSAASTKKAKVKPRSLAETIKFVQTNGKDVDMSPKVAATLGFTPPVHTFGLTYSAETAPDHRNHSISVIYAETEGKKAPTALAWFISKVNEENGVNRLDGFIMRLDTNGKLISLARGQGEVGKVTQTPIDIDSTEAKKIFDDEARFYSTTSVKLSPRK